MQDTELLREYLKSGSETAFAELVKRYVDFVYSTARRQVGDAHLAQEVAQSVFCLLARKAAVLNGRATIAGWLYQATCFTAAKTMRTEMRRRQREQEAYKMNQQDPEPEAMWEHLSPMLDQAMNELGETDRLAVLLRFFQHKPMREVGQALGVSEDAAKVRVSRAVERLRITFAKRGVACASAALGVLLTERAVEGAPSGMASIITAGALTGAAVSTFSFTQALTYLARIKAQTLAVAGVGALILFTGGLHIYNVTHRPAIDGGGSATAIAGSRPDQNGGGNSTSGQSTHAARAGTAKAVVEEGIDLDEAIARLRAALHNTNNHTFPGYEVVDAVKHFGSHGRVAFEVLKEEAGAHDEKNAPTDDAELAPRRAVGGMGFLGKSVPEAVPYLWAIYDSSPIKKTDSMAYAALTALHRIGFEANDIVLLAQHVLTYTNFQESDGFIRSQAAHWIAEIIKADLIAAQPHITTVEDLLHAGDGKVRFWAACALLEYEGAENAVIVDIIKEGLKTADKEMLAWASTSIFKEAGAVAKSIVPALVDAAQASNDKTAKEWAFLAAGNINGELRNEIKEVGQALKKDEDSKSMIKKINAGTATYAELTPYLKEKGSACVTAQLLAKMGKAASNAVPQMIKALNGQDDDSTSKILAAIHKINPKAPIVRLDAVTIASALNEILNEATKEQAAKFFGLGQEQDHPNTWWNYYTRDEFAGFANKLADLDQDGYRAFAKVILDKNPGLKGVFKALPPQ